MQCVTQTIIEKLEDMVASHGLQGVLTALESVCVLKGVQTESLRELAYWRRSAKQMHLVAHAAGNPVDDRCLNM